MYSRIPSSGSVTPGPSTFIKPPWRSISSPVSRRARLFCWCRRLSWLRIDKACHRSSGNCDTTSGRIVAVSSNRIQLSGRRHKTGYLESQLKCVRKRNMALKRVPIKISTFNTQTTVTVKCKTTASVVSTDIR